MAREYGNDLTANIVVRVTEQEKKEIKKAAAKRGISMSELIRLALTE